MATCLEFSKAYKQYALVIVMLGMFRPPAGLDMLNKNTYYTQ
jgi:hypothetical protein